jgi:hypothetical protein
MSDGFNQGPQHGAPIIMLPGIQLPQRPQDNLGLRFNECPVRVEKALEVLGLMAGKQQVKAIASHGNSGMSPSIELIEATELRLSESCLIDAASDFLSKWFAGELEPTEAEKVQLAALDKAVKQRKGQEKSGIINQCMACSAAGTRRTTCKMCKGSGQVLILPMAEGDE